MSLSGTVTSSIHYDRRAHHPTRVRAQVDYSQRYGRVAIAQAATVGPHDEYTVQAFVGHMSRRVADNEPLAGPPALALAT